MKYSIDYKADIKLRKEADEIRTPFSKLGYIYDFMKEYPNKKYIIIIDSIPNNLEKQLAFVKAVVKNNYSIECSQISLLKIIKGQGYNCFYKYAATDWEVFNYLIDLGVSDILIDGPICFDMPTLKKVLDKVYAQIDIRVRPNKSSNVLFANWNNNFLENSFYIRPEDTKFYENLITTFVFSPLAHTAIEYLSAPNSPCTSVASVPLIVNCAPSFTQIAPSLPLAEKSPSRFKMFVPSLYTFGLLITA